MADVYVNLDIATAGAAGTELDPIGYDEFQAVFGTIPFNFFVKGYHDYVDIAGNQTFLLDVAGITSIERWGTDLAKIKVRYSVFHSNKRAFAFGETSGMTLNVKRVLIENDECRMFGRQAGPTSLTNLAVNFENSVLIRNGTNIAAIHLWLDNATNVSLSAKGSVFSNKGASVQGFLVKEGAAQIDSCYFDGPATTVFSIQSGSYKYCGFYNLTGGTIDNGGITDGGGNVGDGSGATQLASLGAINTMSLPADVTPAPGSPLIDAGNPLLGLTTDMFGTVRGTTPNIGVFDTADAPPVPPAPPIVDIIETPSWVPVIGKVTPTTADVVQAVNTPAAALFRSLIVSGSGVASVASIIIPGIAVRENAFIKTH